MILPEVNKMDIGSASNDDLEFNEEDIILINNGLIGLPELKRFILMDLEEDSPLHWLQSVDNKKIGFIVSDPVLFAENYVVTIDNETKNLLRIENQDDMVVMIIVTVKEEGEKITGNLLGPIVVNATKRLGRQVTLDSCGYGTDVPIRKAEDLEESSSDPRVGITV
jgi:flagellar assembly factor FliW